MEDDKRKKRNNKKKKNKQHQHQNQEPPQLEVRDDTSSNAGETSSGDHNHPVNNGCMSAQVGKENWLQEEARLKEMVKQLLYEKNSYTHRQVDLETKIKNLQSDNDYWHEKEVSLEQRIHQLLHEKDSLDLEKGSLQEKVRCIEKERAFLVEKENSSKEMIATLNNENRRLQMQVLELEGAKNNISQDNRQLIDNISSLQSRIQDLERSLASSHLSVDAPNDVSKKDDLNAEIEAACALVEKLVTENAELVEKLNELYVELESRCVAEVTSVGIPDYATGHLPVSISSGDISSSAKSANLFGSVPIEDERVTSDDVDSDNTNVARHSSETAVSGEIVQIPLDENEILDLEAQASTYDETEYVPITDAPLIGAPFRLISFFAKYVSGADLVNQGASKLESEQS